MKPIAHLLLPALLAMANPLAAQVSFSQNFDSMGGTGTTPPAGWSFYAFSGGNASTWVSSIPETDAAGGTVNTTLIQTTTFNTSTTKSSTSGYNFALDSSASDRALGTSPTSISGVALQWAVSNNGASAITSVRVGYDIRRFTAPGTANELPGYWLFYSLDGGTTWTNVTALNPTLGGPGGVIVANTIGVTTVPPTEIPLSSAWSAGSTLLFRWVDDNAVATSADQIIGLDNVTLESAGFLIGEAPAVSLTAPSASASFVAPAAVNLAADASDNDGTITKVEFYQGATKLGEDTTSPYNYSWTNVGAGNYSLTARATDNDGNVTVSAAIGISVNATPGSGSLTRAAYLQQAGPTTMTVRWRSSQTIAGRVKFGNAPASLTTTVDEPIATTDHEVILTGLAPDTTYFYSIGSPADTLAGGNAAHTFRTPPNPGSTPETRIWVLGDAGTGTSSQTAVRDAFYTWTGTRDPNLVLELGDNAYNSGTDSEFQAKVFDIYGPLMKRVPFWSCLGNHETAQSTAFVETYPYFSIYTFPKAGECGGVASGTEHYYSFDYGNIHVISLDSMTADRSPTGAMATWLANDLAATTATWIVCMFHHPPYTKGSHNSDTEAPLMQMRSNILPILEAGGVDLVLCGHSHSYERSYLLDGHYGISTTLTPAMKKNGGDGRPTGNGAYIKPLTGPRDHFGAVYAVPGSAGQISGGTLNHPAHFISLNNLGSLVLDVSGTRLDATFIRENGSLPDTFTIIKQGAADTDKDGIPDAYEITNGLNRFDAADALLDGDHDGLNNLEEYLFGLLPGTSDRYEWTTTFNESTGNVVVSFPTLAGRTYQVDWSPNLQAWNPGSDPMDGDGGIKTWTDDGSATGSAPGSTTRRFYRVQVVGAQ